MITGWHDYDFVTNTQNRVSSQEKIIIGYIFYIL